MVDLNALSLRQQILMKSLESFRSLKPFGMEAFILKHGKFYGESAMPAVGLPDLPKQCFMNCQRSILINPAYRYCEGVGLSEGLPIPVHHAWLTFNDQVIDATWARFASRTIYYGVTLTRESVIDQLAKASVYAPMLFKPHSQLERMIDGKTIREPV